MPLEKAERMMTAAEATRRRATAVAPDAAATAHGRRLGRTRAAIARVRRHAVMGDLLSSAAREAALACRMAELSLYTRHGCELVLAYRYEASHDRLESAQTRRVLLKPGTPAGEMVRRCTPILVEAEQASREARLAGKPGAGYVAAPVVVDETTVAVLVGTLGDERHPSSSDAEHLFEFAERLGWLVERLALRERSDRQVADVRAALDAAGRALDESRASNAMLAFTPPDRMQPMEVLRPSVVPANPLADLTQREHEVLAHMALGQTNRAIATELFLSEGTVKCHVKRILRKLGVANRAEAVARYLGGAPRQAVFGPSAAQEPDLAPDHRPIPPLRLVADPSRGAEPGVR